MSKVSDGTTDTDLPIPSERMPRHVAIIMDGNGRWAKMRGRPRVFGHKNGVDSVRKVVRAAGDWGIEALTLFAFSDENWGRPFDEVSVIMQLLDTYLKREREELHRNNVQFRTIGALDRLNPSSLKLVKETTDYLAGNTGLVLNLALSYSGRAEILRATQRLMERAVKGEISPDEITTAMIDQNLDTAGLPDPDLVIRTSGEQRISNFLLWQAAYAEFYFSPVYWPDFTREEFRRALMAYDQRQRRFGLTSGQLTASFIKESAAIVPN
jgi:undecaprenyl diphosphate synthase